MGKTEVERFLTEYDCPVGYSGFYVLTEAVLYAAEHLGKIKGNMKDVYIEVGNKLNMGRSNIERNMRTLLSVWSETEKFKLLFDTTPTNAKLIITFAHKFIMGRKQIAKKPHRVSIYDVIFS